ncbi:MULTISPECIES: acetyltransferase [unclassified Pseudomonas]|uniref:acetyltransferase n=1 Tax=unclassified Pseudomonas TaxID=196821 RepID=UPI000915ED8A|nr:MULTISPECIES: acetyltransferase [unclassified Pseudomonas]SFX01159.1 sugar O-acyltransferase, sialic acid O-acetyltransferase NeuD family [Pseudomonas sp. NFACC47-1]SFX21527.1 sugar O-acyltransferase, sialic acid O-acetyltransferase NeuD family [Pseudomonas sp. NFACC43]
MKLVKTVKSVVLIGAGGHAKVLLSLATSAGFDVIGVCAPEFKSKEVKEWRGVEVLGDDGCIEQLDPAEVGLINGIGQVTHNNFREIIFKHYRAKGFSFPVLVHPCASVDSTANLGQGVQVMAGATIQADCDIGENTIINTRASIDHDCNVYANVHIAPGAVVCGGCTICEGAFVGAGATIVQSLTVGKNSVIGAGSVLVRSLPADRISLGAKPHITRRLKN